MQFVKMHGAGNDFILVDLLGEQSPGIGPGEDAAWSALARSMCDRHFGIGSDGLLLVAPSDTADVRMRMFNPDGSESASCGNGIRCLGRYVRDRHGLGRPELRVETGSGVSAIAVAPDGSVSVDMGAPVFEPSRIPAVVSGDDALKVMLNLDGHAVAVSCVSMGNPHAVTFVERGGLDAYPLETVGPKVERHATFPERTNFEVCEVLAPDHLRVRVWERGAGVTLACGTGACASAVVAAVKGHARSPVRVGLPGGQLSIEWSEGRSVLMTGPTAYVFTGTWSMDRNDQLLIPSEAAPVAG
ncbi:MAG: diaminopimelate epimerase [Chloroflexi bacterium]|nr:diaminopimelate epimerase [Chloroflexota bacterium]